MTSHQLFITILSFVAGVVAFLAYLSYSWLWAGVSLVCLIFVLLECSDENKDTKSSGAKY